MKSSSSLRRLDSLTRTKENLLQWVLGLDRHQKVISASDNNPFHGQESSALVGRSLEQISALRHFHALLAKGFGFKSVPVPIDDRWYAAEYLPGGADGTLAGGELVLTTLDRGNEAAMVLHDFVQSIDPFSLDAGGGNPAG